MKIWITSDTHLGHSNIRLYCNRPFSSTEEMDETIVSNWNTVIKPGDLVYHLGDVAIFRKDRDRVINLIGKLNGQKYLIKGNHDKELAILKEHFIWIKDLHTITIPDLDFDRGSQKIILCHYPMRSWDCSSHSSWMLHGHCHGSLLEDPKLLSTDMSVDCWDFTPVDYESIKKYMGMKETRCFREE